MQINVLEYLERTVARVPDKLAYADEESGMTFREVSRAARAIGTFLAQEGFSREPVAVFMRKSPQAVAAFFGAVYGGDFYVPLDEEMPRHRIELIFQTLQPRIVLCDAATEETVRSFAFSGRVCRYEDLAAGPVDDAALAAIRSRAIDTDPIYIVFTSGSTGVPKGVVACHRSVLDYIESLSEVLRFDEDTVFGNQSPFYFDACLKELYPTIKFGATTWLVPRQKFSFPIQLVEFLNAHKINTICWVVSALTMISAFGVLDKVVPRYLRTVAFGSEVFPIKQFDRWRRALPDARFVNLYGPTETTGMCCYYEVDREFSPGDTLPIGRPFRNTEILLLDEHNQLAQPGEPGEICVRGTSLTLGYYRDFERTDAAFVQNPLNTAYHELIYRTGDIGRRNERGELEFLSRRDAQIKHMGHRIELGEIEVIVATCEGVKSCCALFDHDKKKIVLYYVGDLTPAALTAFLKEKLPRYMLPNVIEQLDTMPLTPNGKVNRVELRERYQARRR